jgi:predicted nucleic acid-binding protein
VIIADTGFFLALANADDHHHAVAEAALRRLREPLITTWPVMTVACHLLLARVGTAAEVAFVRSARAGAFQLFSLAVEHLERIESLMQKYRDLPMDLADASLVVLAETLGSGRILSTDRRDFKTYRWKNRRPFSNLLLPD